MLGLFLEIPLESGNTADTPTGLWLNTDTNQVAITRVDTYQRPTTHGQKPTRCTIHYRDSQETQTVEGENNVTRFLDALRAIPNHAAMGLGSPAGAGAAGAR